ncbi:MAG TPA: MarR family transcriptional regulator [Chloroflexia bacterium]|nr:MarR family transcriptional regulator [Chloroflexia bacterium]
MDEQQHLNGQNERLIGALLRVPFLKVIDAVYKALVAEGFNDLTRAHLAVFRHINDRAGSRLTELAEDAQMTKQSMGYLVDHLEERGYLERVPDSEDGRARLVRLTRRGHEVMSVARRVVLGVEEEWARLIGKRKMQHLREALKELVAVLESKK